LLTADLSPGTRTAVCIAQYDERTLQTFHPQWADRPIFQTAKSEHEGMPGGTLNATAYDS
jgi:hypothetical protein